MKIMIPSKNDLIIPKTCFLGAQLLYNSLWNLRPYARGRVSASARGRVSTSARGRVSTSRLCLDTILQNSRLPIHSIA